MIQLAYRFSQPVDTGLILQAKDPSRATLFDIGRDGPTAVMLTTLPGDTNVAGSGVLAERCDLVLPASAAYGNAGQEEWWANSVLFPHAYVVPPTGEWGEIFDFHHTQSGGGQANVQVVSRPTGLEVWVSGGPTLVNAPTDPGFHSAVVGPVVKGVWQDFLWHVKWGPDATGLTECWLNGQQLMSYAGPNLYTGQSCYLKIANYHSAIGVPVSVVHSRVWRGTSRTDVAIPRLTYVAGVSFTFEDLLALESGTYSLT